jgi:hypothetical protein
MNNLDVTKFQKKKLGCHKPFVIMKRLLFFFGWSGDLANPA